MTAVRLPLREPNARETANIVGSVLSSRQHYYDHNCGAVSDGGVTTVPNVGTT